MVLRAPHSHTIVITTTCVFTQPHLSPPSLPYHHPTSLSLPRFHKLLTIPIREHPMCLNLTPIRTFPCLTTTEIMKLQFGTLTIVNYLFLTIPTIGIRHTLHSP